MAAYGLLIALMLVMKLAADSPRRGNPSNDDDPAPAWALAA